MQLLDDFLGQQIVRAVDHVIDGAEVMDRLQNVVHWHAVARVEGIRLKDQARLIFGQTAALDVVRVVGHPHLELMVQSAGDLRSLLLTEGLQDRIV